MRIIKRFFIYLVARIHTLTTMLLIDFIANGIFLCLSLLPKNFKKVNEGVKELVKIKKDNLYDHERVFSFLKKKYRYKWDGSILFGWLHKLLPWSKGFPDWNIRCKRVLVQKDYNDDCDGFAYMSSYFLEGKKYLLIPTSFKKFRYCHVIFYSENLRIASLSNEASKQKAAVFSSGAVEEGFKSSCLEDYLKSYEKLYGDFIKLRIW